MAGTMSREGQRKEKDGWGKEIMKEIMNELREMRQELLKEVKREGEELRREMKQIKRQLERMEKSQAPGRQRKESGGRGEAEKRRVDESDGVADVGEKPSEEEIEREEKIHKGRCVEERSKHEGERRTERGGGDKGRSRNGREEVTSEEEESSEESWKFDRREGKGKGNDTHERTMERRGGDVKTEKEKERCEKVSEDGSASKEEKKERRTDGETGSEGGRKAEKKGRGAESVKSNAWEMVMRREEKVKSERDRSVRESV
ncbi:uncharacterized protein [Temnothorax longispinosus]|uniref:uncharacterized protein n=1 Tax=Temnothorax longispinosus TaxID=300112 RepID=UPI003A99B0EA